MLFALQVEPLQEQSDARLIIQDGLISLQAVQ